MWRVRCMIPHQLKGLEVVVVGGRSESCCWNKNLTTSILFAPVERPLTPRSTHLRGNARFYTLWKILFRRPPPEEEDDSTLVSAAKEARQVAQSGRGEGGTSGAKRRCRPLRGCLSDTELEPRETPSPTTLQVKSEYCCEAFRPLPTPPHQRVSSTPAPPTAPPPPPHLSPRVQRERPLTRRQPEVASVGCSPSWRSRHSPYGHGASRPSLPIRPG